MVDVNELLKNRIDLTDIAFTDRGSRLLVFYRDDKIQIFLAEKWTGIDQEPILTIELLDNRRQPLSFELETYPHSIRLWHLDSVYQMLFATPETLLMHLNSDVAYIRLRLQTDKVNNDRRGGIAYDDHHLIAYTTDVDMNQQVSDADLHTTVLLKIQSGTTFNMQFHITSSRANNRYIPDFEAVLQSAIDRWQDWFEQVPTVPEMYQKQYYFAWWIIGVNLIRPRFHPQREGVAPSKLGYVGIWNWDSYFHAIALRHADMKLAQDQFRLFFDYQLSNGMLPDVIHDDGVITHTTYRFESEVTKPPLTAWAIWKLYEIEPDTAFLQEIYDVLVRSQEWWFNESDTDNNGICEYQHPYSAGLDDSPLFDDGVPVESPDLTAYLILQFDTLAKIATAIGLIVDAERWTSRAEELTRRLIDLRWDENEGIFTAWHGDQQIDVITPFHLFPLITGRLPREIARQLVDMLMDEEYFWTLYPVPTVAKSDPKYDAMQMWRGPVWVNINYLLVDGLRRAGFVDASVLLRQKTIEMVQAHDNIYEYYNPQTGENPPNAVAMFSWGSACLIDLILQEVSDDNAK